MIPNKMFNLQQPNCFNGWPAWEMQILPSSWTRYRRSRTPPILQPYLGKRNWRSASVHFPGPVFGEKFQKSKYYIACCTLNNAIYSQFSDTLNGCRAMR